MVEVGLVYLVYLLWGVETAKIAFWVLLALILLTGVGKYIDPSSNKLKL